MRARKLPRYLAGAAKALLSAGPRAVLKLAARSPYVVAEVAPHGFSMVLPAGDPAIARPILLIQEYERNVTEVLLAHARDDTRFLDVGASVGFFTLLMAMRCPAGRVTSVEPDAESFRLLSASIALNDLQERVTAYQVAASDREESLFFSDLGHRPNLGARFVAKNRETLEQHAAGPGVQTRRVHAVSLDALLEGERVDLVKVDIEGFEPNAFKGMEQLLRRNRPAIVTEFAPGTIRHISGVDPCEMLGGLVEFGYVLSVIEEDGGLTTVGGDTAKVMERFGNPRLHHVDLLLRPA